MMNNILMKRLVNLSLTFNRSQRLHSQKLRSCLMSMPSNSKQNLELTPTLFHRSFSKVGDNYRTNNVIAVGPDGTKYDIPMKPLGNYTTARHAPKLAPRIKNARIAKLKTVEGKIENIRHSPWRMNLICQFVAGQTVPNALLQLQFCEKAKAPLVTTLLQRTINTAKQKFGLLPSQLEVSECFATHGSHLKRVKVMGRGRSGKKLRRFSHVRMVLREIDFPLKIIAATTTNQRKKWIQRMESALKDKEIDKLESQEIESLEKELQESRRKHLSET